MELLKLLSANELVTQIISFLIFFFIMRALAWKRVLKLLDDRRDRVAKDLSRIDDMKADIEKTKADCESRLATIQDASREEVKRAVEEGRKIAADIVAKAEAEASRVVEASKREIEVELKKAKEDLRSRIVELTLQATERVLEEKLEPEVDEKVVGQFLDNLDSL